MKRGRHSKTVGCEVVRVASTMFLVSARQNACRYETADDKPLAVGYYLALWPKMGSCVVYGREFRYLGPFATKHAAHLLQTSALEFGIVDSVVDGERTAKLLPPASLARVEPDGMFMYQAACS